MIRFNYFRYPSNDTRPLPAFVVRVMRSQTEYFDNAVLVTEHLIWSHFREACKR